MIGQQGEEIFGIFTMWSNNRINGDLKIEIRVQYEGELKWFAETNFYKLR